VDAVKSNQRTWPVRVLCVDDNKDIADSEAMLLEVVGFEVEVCYDGRSALSVAETFHPRVCLLDLDMPGMDGDELAARIRAALKGECPVMVALTARGDENSVDRIRAAGFDLHLTKPVNPNQLVGALNRLTAAGS
jgi:two-component system OmpR family response regulator